VVQQAVARRNSLGRAEEMEVDMKPSKWMLWIIVAMLATPVTGCVSHEPRKLENEVYLFWTPNSSKLRASIDKLDESLNEKCGGFSRWAIDGGWRDPESKRDLTLPGYFYMISCKSITASELAKIIRDLFQSKEVYILELPARRFTGE
jgi:hypothetical protein